jgi:hypothetical protein
MCGIDKMANVDQLMLEARLRSRSKKDIKKYEDNIKSNLEKEIAKAHSRLYELKTDKQGRLTLKGKVIEAIPVDKPYIFADYRVYDGYPEQKTRTHALNWLVSNIPDNANAYCQTVQYCFDWKYDIYAFQFYKITKNT